MSTTPAAPGSSNVPNPIASQRPAGLPEVKQQQPPAPNAPTSAPDISPEEMLKKKYAHRAKIVQEIFTTEQSYCASLHTLCQLAIPALQPLLTEEETRLLFSNITTISTFNSNFCEELNRRTRLWTDASCIGDVFLQFTPFFRMYTQYVSNHDNAIVFYRDFVQTSKYKKVEKEIFGDPRFGNTKDLMHFLIMPIQRIPRYKLLLNELIKYTPESHPDRVQCQKAHDLIAEVATQVNNEIKQQQNRLLLIEKEKQLALSQSLVTPSRYFVKQGPMTKVCRSSDVVYEFFLFNDLLIYASKNALGKWKPHRMITINSSMVLSDIQDTDKRRNMFHIVNYSKSFGVYTTTAEEKKEWMTEIQKCVDLVRTSVNASKLPTYNVPVWQPDDHVQSCLLCKKDFTIFNRRHHCRFCGSVICNSCSKHRSACPTGSNEKLRICDRCHQQHAEDEARRLRGETVDNHIQPEMNKDDPEIINSDESEKELFRPGHRVYKALFPFQSEHQGDLQYNVGDVIEVYVYHNTWWTGRIRGTHNAGIFPSEYLELHESDQGEPLVKARYSAICSESYASDGTNPHLLEFNKGDIVCISEQTEDGWCYALNLMNDQLGYIFCRQFFVIDAENIDEQAEGVEVHTA